jgi:hypothetical protein
MGRDASRAAAAQLANARPPIVVPHAPLDRGELVIAPEAIRPEDRAHVEAALTGLAAGSGIPPKGSSPP